MDLGPLGLYEEIDDARPLARDSCTSYAAENTDYLTVISKAFNKILRQNRPRERLSFRTFLLEIIRAEFL